MLTNSGKCFVIMAISVSVLTTGCASKTTNQVKQQTAPMQQAQNIPYANNAANTASRVDIANEASNKIAQINGIKQANVLVTRRNAYVAAVVNTPQGTTTPELESQIASQVRAADPSVQNVYVSTNPEFVDRVNRYVQDVGQGRPVAGFAEEFSAIIQRLFPTAR